MSELPTHSAPISDLESLQRAFTEKAELVQSVRQELVRSQITVLELQDTALQKETDKADAVALLGQAELVLEGKINYIFELDRILNQRIAGLERELSETRSAQALVVQDLVAKLDAANREVGAAHTLAAGYAREVAETRELLKASDNALESLKHAHADMNTVLVQTRQELADVQSNLARSSAANAVLERQLDKIYRSFWWRITSVFRSEPRKSP